MRPYVLVPPSPSRPNNGAIKKADLSSASSIAEAAAPAPVEAKVTKPKKRRVVPAPTWTEVNASLTKSEVEDRFFVSEPFEYYS